MQGNKESMEERIQKLLEKRCYVVDFLPERVAEDSKGQFFEVEAYWLEGRRRMEWKDKFVHVILKLMCYYHVSAAVRKAGFRGILPAWERDWMDGPSPQSIEKAVSAILEDGSGTLYVLLPEEEVLVVLEGDSLHLSVYNPPEKVRSLMERLASSEGLFWWEGK